VYLSDSGGHGNLWVLNLETQQTRPVTFEQDPLIAIGVPVWSPDGKYIAYVKRGLSAWNVDLWLMNPDGSNSHKISDGGGWACWSPDSRWLYFSPPGQNGFRIEKASPAGGPNLLVREEGRGPAVDAEGKLFFIMSLPAQNGLSDMEILVANPENGPAQRLVGAHFRISLVKLALDAARALARRQTAGGAVDRWTDHEYLGTTHGRWRDAAHHGLWDTSDVHCPENLLVVGRALCLRCSGKRRG
jgi:dipeptidyl aminopeptidase/acylaminoacyl peptidase